MARTALDGAGLSGTDGAPARYPYELSGGQRQRVAIAIATVLSPSLLIADEPTTALDAGSQAEVLRLLAALSRDRGMGLMLISHDFAVISRMTDRVAVMQGGRIVEQGPTRELLTTPHHPYTQALLAAANLDAKRPGRRESGSPAVLEVREIVRQTA